MTSNVIETSKSSKTKCKLCGKKKNRIIIIATIISLYESVCYLKNRDKRNINSNQKQFMFNVSEAKISTNLFDVFLYYFLD